MLHLWSSEVTAILTFTSVAAVVIYNLEVFASQALLQSLLTIGGFIILLRTLAAGRACPSALQSPTAASGRIVLVTGANGTMGLNLCRCLLATGATVIVCCRSAKQSQVTAQKLQSEANRKGYSGTAVAFGGADATNIPSIAEYARSLKAFLSEKGWVLDTAVLAVGMLSPTLQYVDISTGEAALPSADKDNATIKEIDLASNGIATHHFASLLMPMLARGGLQQTPVADGSAPTSHPRRLIIVASSAHTHLGTFTSKPSPINMIKAMHRHETVKVNGSQKSTQPKPAAKGTSDQPLASNAALQLANSMARAMFYPDFVKIYGLSKLLNIYTGLTLVEMAERQRASYLRSKGVTAKFEERPRDEEESGGKVVKVVMIHPGIFGSGLYRRLLPWPLLQVASILGTLVMKTGWDSAQTALLTCLEDWSKLRQGGYYYDCKEYGPTSPICNSLSAVAMDSSERHKAVEWMATSILAATRKANASLKDREREE